MDKTIKYVLILLAIVALVAGLFGYLLYAAITTQQSIPSSGTVAAIGVNVYSNSALTTPLTSIPWGTVDPGGTSTITAYIQNSGDEAETLALSVGSYSPSTASTYITISWNLPSGYSLAAGANTSVTFTLSVSSSVTGITTFSATLTITGTGS